MTVRCVVTVQARREWPAKDYPFNDPRQARMFVSSCKRDGDYRVELRELPA
jgi:hypothetical protein